MYDIHIIIDRKEARTELRGTDTVSQTPQDAVARALVDCEMCEGDRGMSIQVVPHTCTVCKHEKYGNK
jgi:hypothetical protein